MEEYNSIHDLIMDESFLSYSLQRSQEDIDKWESYLDQHPAQYGLVQQAKSEVILLHEAIARIDAEENYKKLDSRINKKPKKLNLRSKAYYYIAACLALFISVTSVWIYYLQPKAIRADLYYTTQPAERKNIELPDGTLIKLNTDSRLFIAEGFGQSNRNVTLIGEAYMQVAKNPELPFMIETNTLDVRVLGTTLNIRAYPNEDLAAASLIEGSAEVILKSGNTSPIRLKPSDKIVTLTDPKQMDPENTDLKELKTKSYVMESVRHYDEEQGLVETSWTEKKLVFANEPLSSIAKTLERWYNIKIEFHHDDNIKNRKYTATFDESEQLQSVLESLRESQTFKYRKTGARTITITSD